MKAVMKGRYYTETFGSYEEFFNCLIDRQPNAHKKLEAIFNNGGADWVGVESVKKAKELLLKGWEENVEKMKLSIDKQLKSNEKNTARMFGNVSGFIPIVPNAIMGLPKSMLDCKMEKRKTKILSFKIIPCYAWHNDVDDIIKKMSKHLAMISSLERDGYRCRIEVCFPFNAEDCDKKIPVASILVKSENQPFDIKRLNYPIVNTSMFRLFMFGWYESIPLKIGDYFDSGYGVGYDHWEDRHKKELAEILQDGNSKTIIIGLNDNFEKEVFENA